MSANTIKNPKTGRLIKINGALYNKLVADGTLKVSSATISDKSSKRSTSSKKQSTPKTKIQPSWYLETYEEGMPPEYKFYLNRKNAIIDGIDYYVNAFGNYPSNPYDKEKERKEWLKDLRDLINEENDDIKTPLELGRDEVYFNVIPIKYEDDV